MIPFLLIAAGGLLIVKSVGRYSLGGKVRPRTLEDVCDVRTGFPEADFWVQRKGSERTIGTPKKTYGSEDIGVRVKDEYRGRISPTYLFYAIEHLHMTGGFEPMAVGSLSLKNLRTTDLRSIPVSFKSGGRVYNDKELLRRYRSGESIGFSAVSHLKAKGLIPRSHGKKEVSEKYRGKKRLALRK